MAKFICKRCSYNFEIKKERVPKYCPYCNSENSVEKERSAEEIMNEI